MWDLIANKEIGIFGKHDRCISTLCLSQDGNILYSTGSGNRITKVIGDYSIKMWNLNNQNFSFFEKMFFFNTYQIKNEKKFKHQIKAFKNLFSKLNK